jgi:hypothetical protein
MPKNEMLPQTYAELERWAAKAAASDFVPKEYRGKPESVLICAQYAIEIGMGIIPGLQSIAVINGKPSLYGDGLIALCYASPVCEYIKETPILSDAGDITGYVCEAKRKGQDAKFARYTTEDAKKAKLIGKSGPWQEYPQRMLQMRARGFALRDAFPDVLKGLISREEAQDYPPVEHVVSVPSDDPMLFHTPEPQRITSADAEEIARLADEAHVTADEFGRILSRVGAKTVNDVAPGRDHTRIINTLYSIKRRREENANS